MLRRLSLLGLYRASQRMDEGAHPAQHGLERQPA